jgi:glycosyltransferase involved in cell wall biosynthesis
MPNVDAVEYLCAEIWPLIRKQLPDETLYIVGADPPPEVLRHHNREHGVEVLGFIPSMAELYRSMQVNVAPLRFGAGVKGKVVSAMTVGLPTVATTIAFEGMELVKGNEILVADDPSLFAGEVVRVCSDPHLWLRLSDAGIAAAQERFSVEAIESKIGSLLRDLGLPA